MRVYGTATTVWIADTTGQSRLLRFLAVEAIWFSGADFSRFPAHIAADPSPVAMFDSAILQTAFEN